MRLLGIDESGDWRWHVKPLMTGMARSSSAFEALAFGRGAARCAEFAGVSCRVFPREKGQRTERRILHFKLFCIRHASRGESFTYTFLNCLAVSYEAPAAAIDLTARTTASSIKKLTKRVRR